MSTGTQREPRLRWPSPLNIPGGCSAWHWTNPPVISAMRTAWRCESSSLKRLEDLPAAERMRVFAHSLVRPGVQLPPPAPPAPGPESAKSPQGLLAFEAALYKHELNVSALRLFSGPVYFSFGSLSSLRWEQMSVRMSSWFPRCRVERYDGLHHLNTSHQAEPARVAHALRELWKETKAER